MQVEITEESVSRLAEHARLPISFRVESAQQINVAACRFYAARGCRLDFVRPDAYPTLPDEIQLVWAKDIAAPAADAAG